MIFTVQKFRQQSLLPDIFVEWSFYWIIIELDLVVAFEPALSCGSAQVLESSNKNQQSSKRSGPSAKKQYSNPFINGELANWPEKISPASGQKTARKKSFFTVQVEESPGVFRPPWQP